MADDRKRIDDPLALEEDHAKERRPVSEEGPPVAQMASTFGSSFVESEEHAEAIAADATEEADGGQGTHGGLGASQNPGPNAD